MWTPLKSFKSGEKMVEISSRLQNWVIGSLVLGAVEQIRVPVWCLCRGRGSQQTLGVMTSEKMGGGRRNGSQWQKQHMCMCEHEGQAVWESHVGLCGLRGGVRNETRILLGQIACCLSYEGCGISWNYFQFWRNYEEWKGSQTFKFQPACSDAEGQRRECAVLVFAKIS